MRLSQIVITLFLWSQIASTNCDQFRILKSQNVTSKPIESQKDAGDTRNNIEPVEIELSGK